MSLVNDLKKEVFDLKKKVRDLENTKSIIDLENQKKDETIKSLKKEIKDINSNETINPLGKSGRDFSKLVDLSIKQINKSKSTKKKYATCSLTQSENITEGIEYLVIDEYLLKGNIMIEIIDNNNVIRKYVKKKFFDTAI